MGAARLSERNRKKLTALLAEDRPEAAKLLARLRELRDVDGVPSCAAVIHMLSHLELPEVQAERLLVDLLRHRDEIAAALGRDPGLRVATIDFLSNVKKLMANPTIVERAQLERTERSAVTDPLTRLYNRRFFMGALNLEVRRSHRYSLRMSLLMLDLDEFKRLNDRYGHLVGDLVLQRVGQALRRTVRDADLACRYGGEEFTVILPETDRLGAYAVAERVRRRIAAAFEDRPVRGESIRVGLSGGIAALPEDGLDAQSLLARADQALYRSKRLGKNRISLYHSERRREVRFPARRSARVGVQPEGLEARLVNVSHHGALLEMQCVGPTAGALELTLDGRDVSGDSRRWVHEGRVVRLDPETRLVAVEFANPLERECLEQQTRRARPAEVGQGGRP